MIDDLLTEIDEHLRWRAVAGRPLSESTLGLLAVNDGKLLTRLRAGGQITVKKLDSIRRWIQEDRASTGVAA